MRHLAAGFLALGPWPPRPAAALICERMEKGLAAVSSSHAPSPAAGFSMSLLATGVGCLMASERLIDGPCCLLGPGRPAGTGSPLTQKPSHPNRAQGRGCLLRALAHALQAA